MTEPTRRDWLRGPRRRKHRGRRGTGRVFRLRRRWTDRRRHAGNGGPGNGTDDGGSDGGDRPTEASDDGVKTQFRQGLRNTGYIDATIPESVETAWEVPANSGDHSASKGSPIEAPNGAIVLADDTGRVQSIAPDGSVNWATSISDDDRGSHGTPAIADGSLYVGHLRRRGLGGGARRRRDPVADRRRRRRGRRQPDLPRREALRRHRARDPERERRQDGRGKRRIEWRDERPNQPPALDGRDRPGARPPHLRLQRRPLLRVVVPRVGARGGPTTPAAT